MHMTGPTELHVYCMCIRYCCSIYQLEYLAYMGKQPHMQLTSLGFGIEVHLLIGVPEHTFAATFVCAALLAVTQDSITQHSTNSTD